MRFVNETVNAVLDIAVEQAKQGTPFWVIGLALYGAYNLVFMLIRSVSFGVMSLAYIVGVFKWVFVFLKSKRVVKKDA